MNEDGGSIPGGVVRGDLPPLVPSKPPSLLPIPGREPHLSIAMNQQDKQVQAAMAMAAFYSQSPLWQQMVAARERLQHATVPHPAAQAAMAALTQLPGRAPPMPCLPGLPGLPGFPGLAGLQSSLGLTSTSSSHNATTMAGLPGAATVLEQSKHEMYRDYLSKLAQSTLHVTTSGGGGPTCPPSPQYLQTLQASKADNMSENSLPRNVRLSSSPSNLTQENITSRNIRSPPLNYIGRDSLPQSLVGAQTNPFFVGLQPNQLQQQPTKPINNRSPTNGGPRRTSNGTGREKVFTCNVCNRSFGYKHVLQNHERTHTGEKPFECKECHKRFTRDHHLKTHMRLHTGEKPYSCSHCDRQFVQVANLRRHLRVHTGERPYKCDLCPSNFSDSNQLKAHNLIHKGEKPFNCDKCGGKFRRRHHLMHHVCPMDEKKVNLNTNQFLNLKEELLLRYTGAGFPHSGINIPATMKPTMDDGRSSNASLSPDSKDTGSGGSPTPGEADSTGEKRRSRKQKPRRVIQWTEEGGGDESPRNVSSTSFHRSPVVPEQTEPEDLTIFRNNHQDIRNRLSRDHDLVQAYQKERTISQYSMAAYAVKEEEPREDDYSDNDRVERVNHNFAHFNQVDKVKREEEHNRSEEEGSTSVSDPHSAHSTPGAEKFRSEDMDEDEDEKRGVSPPMSNTPFYNPLFSHPAAIQLGLASTTMPLASLAGHAQVGRYAGEKETEWEKNIVHKEISQQ